jgi:hypothetical protein
MEKKASTAITCQANLAGENLDTIFIWVGFCRAAKALKAIWLSAYFINRVAVLVATLVPLSIRLSISSGHYRLQG